MNQTVVNSLAQFQQIVLNEDKAKTFDLLKQFDLIKHNGIKKCNKGHVMEIKEFRNRTDGYVWRCGKKGCQTHKSIRENTFFANGKIKIWQILMIIFNWVAEFMQKTSMQILDVHRNTISNYHKKIRLIILRQLNKNEIKIGGLNKIVEIDESLFVRVKHNRGSDMHRQQVWIFGMYERPDPDQPRDPRKVLFFKVATRDATTLLNIIYKHVLPGTTIYSDMWASYNQIINLDRRYQHRTVNHSINFVAPDGTHTNSIESAWRLAKVQFKRMHGVSRIYLQSLLDEHTWRLLNGHKDLWQVLKTVLEAISAYYANDDDADAELDRTIQRIDDEISNDIRNNVDMMDFNEMGKEQLELPPGNYENLFMLNVATLTNTNEKDQ